MSVPYFDAHCDTATRFRDLRSSTCHIDLERLRKYEGAAQVFALFARPGFDRPSVFRSLYRRFSREMAKNSDIVRLVRSTAEADEASREGKIAAFLSVEGAGLIGCSAAGLSDAYRLGVRIVTLCWNRDNALCGSAQDSGAGLSADGVRFIGACEALGVAVDLSHASEQTFWDVMDTAKKPVICTHSNAKAVCAHPRNLTDAQIEAVVKAGGAIGLNFSPDFVGHGRNIDALLMHIDRFLSLGAEKTLCLGGDLDGIASLPDGLAGVEDMDKLYDAMLRSGIGEETARDIFFNNLHRYLEAVL